MTVRAAPRVRLSRAVDWQDTDASGHYHHSAMIRWVEAAEAEMHQQLGVPQLFGVVPRVHYEVDYTERIWFGDRITVTLEVVHVGTTSVRYAFTVIRNGDSAAARGSLTAVYVDRETGDPTPWPDAIRQQLARL